LEILKRGNFLHREIENNKKEEVEKTSKIKKI